MATDSGESGERGVQRDRDDRPGGLVVALAVLTAPDEEVYKQARMGRCAWIECPKMTHAARFCPRHRAWRVARNRMKVRTALLVKALADELATMGYPVAAS